MMKIQCLVTFGYDILIKCVNTLITNYTVYPSQCMKTDNLSLAEQGLLFFPAA